MPRLHTHIRGVRPFLYLVDRHVPPRCFAISCICSSLSLWLCAQTGHQLPALTEDGRASHSWPTPHLHLRRLDEFKYSRDRHWPPFCTCDSLQFMQVSRAHSGAEWTPVALLNLKRRGAPSVTCRTAPLQLCRSIPIAFGKAASRREIRRSVASLQASVVVTSAPSGHQLPFRMVDGIALQR